MGASRRSAKALIVSRASRICSLFPSMNVGQRILEDLSTLAGQRAMYCSRQSSVCADQVVDTLATSLVFHIAPSGSNVDYEAADNGR